MLVENYVTVGVMLYHNKKESLLRVDFCPASTERWRCIILFIKFILSLPLYLIIYIKKFKYTFKALVHASPPLQLQIKSLSPLYTITFIYYVNKNTTS